MLQRNKIKNKFIEIGVVISLLLLWLLLSIVTPYFRRVGNLINLLLQVSTNTIIGVGMTLVILTGGIDLSVGSVVAVCATSLALVNKHFAAMDLEPASFFLLAILLPMVLSVLMGALMGFINGILIAYSNLPPFIMTFGMQSIARGIAYIITHSQTISGFSDGIRFLGNTNLFGVIPLPIIIALVLVVIMAYVLKYTKFGRYIYALGGNSEALLLSGVNAKHIKVAAYTICSLICGFSAIITVGRFNVAAPVTGLNYEMDAIAATIVGGTSMNGGRGSVYTTFIGALLIGTIRNGLNLLNVDSSIQPVVIGLVIVVAVYLDMYNKNKLAEKG